MSAANVDRFTKFLLMECEDSGVATYVNTLLDLAKAQILSGKGAVGFLQTAAANGKTVSQAEALSCDEVAFACRQALRLYRDDVGNSPFTFLDFSASAPSTTLFNP